MTRFYVSIPSSGSIQFLRGSSASRIERRHSLNPLKRVNSILTYLVIVHQVFPSEFVSIPSSGSIQFLRSPSLSGKRKGLFSLNPLKRVNSILTAAFSSDCGAKCCEGKKDSDGKRWVEGVGGIFFDLI